MSKKSKEKINIYRLDEICNDCVNQNPYAEKGCLMSIKYLLEDLPNTSTFCSKRKIGLLKGDQAKCPYCGFNNTIEEKDVDYNILTEIPCEKCNKHFKYRANLAYPTIIYSYPTINYE